jgi:hypothetical protein
MTAMQGEGQSVISEDGVVTFFHVRGKLEEGRRLISDTATGALGTLEITESVIGFVLSTLINAYSTGLGSRIVHLEMGPHDAMVLYLEGQLDAERLQHAVTQGDRIDIPGVVFLGGHSLILRISRQTEHKIIVTDARGNNLYDAIRAYRHH